ncbi:ARM repeat-containing protein [Lactarius sanguifluus]|nr:ARM repeat-containing protein [Lactarius sanguifluus]
MPKDLRKRGKRHKKSQPNAQPQPELIEEGPSSGPSWIVSRPPNSNQDQVDSEAPFGYVDPEMKAYFRTVEDQLKEWQQNWGDAEGNEDIDSNENKRMFLMAALQEISGKERELATDPECAGGLERMAYSMDDFVRRVFVDSLTGSYELLIKHRFASHVIQTLLNVAASTIARESRGVLPKVEDSSDKGQLRTLTQLILDFSEEILPSLPALIMDQFASHVVRALFLLLCPHLFGSSAPHRSQAFVRSRKSAAWKTRQGPLTSIFGDTTDKGKASVERVHPVEFREVAKKYVTMLRTTLDENEVRSLAANKVACPVLQMALEIEADQGLSDKPGSLMDHVLVGLISGYHDDPSFVPQASDYLVTLLRDPTSSHLLETLVSRCPEPVFGILWTTYFERNLRKLSIHPVANFVVAKALERAKVEQLSYALNELRDSLGKLRQSRIGILRALIERAAALTILEAEVCEAICFAFEVNTEEDRTAFVPWALSLKSKSEYAAAVKAKATMPPDPESPGDHPKKHSGRPPREVATDPLEPTTSGALLVQSLLHLHAPHNALVLDSIESLQPQELLALTHHPAGSRVLDAVIDGATTPPRARRSLLRALEAHFADVIDDRIGARVGARCWAAADPYLKEKLARALLPHAARLAGSQFARSFTRGLGLSLLQRKPEEWRRMHATPSVFASASGGVTSSAPAPAPASVPHAGTTSCVVEPAPGGKARKKRKRDVSMVEDEIDALFEGALGRKIARSALAVGLRSRSRADGLDCAESPHDGNEAGEAGGSKC